MNSSQNNHKDITALALKSAVWIKKNLSTFYLICGIVIGSILLIIAFYYRNTTLTLRSEERLSVAQSMLYGDKPEDGVKILDEIITSYANTAASFRASIAKAQHLSDTGNYKDAEDILIKLLVSPKPKELEQFAFPLLTKVQENAGKYKEAIYNYNDFLKKFPNSYLVPSMLQDLAMLYEIEDMPKEAKTTYEKITMQFPATNWSAKAQQRLVTISGTVPGQKVVEQKQ